MTLRLQVRGLLSKSVEAFKIKKRRHTHEHRNPQLHQCGSSRSCCRGRHSQPLPFPYSTSSRLKYLIDSSEREFMLIRCAFKGGYSAVETTLGVFTCASRNFLTRIRHDQGIFCLRSAVTSCAFALCLPDHGQAERFDCGKSNRRLEFERSGQNSYRLH